jgi:membrane fusion protein (multidrug efflux system)
MASTNDRRSEAGKEARPAPSEAVSAEAKDVSPTARTDHAAHPDQQAALTTGPLPATPPTPSAAKPPSHPWRKWLLLAGVVVGLAVGGYFLVPWVVTALNTVSTDDAYVNGHVTFVAPRVAGQVTSVLVDDNYRVKKGDLLVQLDKEPYQVQVAIKKAAVVAAEADLVAAKAQVRGLEALARSQRWQLQNAMEQAATQIANLRANVATLQSRKATLALARANLKRGEDLAPSGGISKEDLDVRRQTVKVDEAAVEQALQAVYATRVGLGLPPQPPTGDLAEVPPNLEQTYSAVRTALANLIQTISQIGLPLASSDSTPRQALADFLMRDFRPLGVVGAGVVGALGPLAGQGPLLGLANFLAGKGDIDRILEQILSVAPAVQQAEAKLLQARSDLDQALLNLRYTDIVSEIDGVVTRRNVNPGNDVSVGQSLMAVRALRPPDLWIDANFKETQLADLRIGQRVRLEVDMYGSRREYEGRISGFTMGTGQTLALLPPQNATGNFVKIVQRLPVRIELTNYDPNHEPLFVGLSVVPYVYYKEPPTGPHAGEVLQPPHPLPQLPTNPKP